MSMYGSATFEITRSKLEAGKGNLSAAEQTKALCGKLICALDRAANLTSRPIICQLEGRLSLWGVKPSPQPRSRTLILTLLQRVLGRRELAIISVLRYSLHYEHINSR